MAGHHNNAPHRSQPTSSFIQRIVDRANAQFARPHEIRPASWFGRGQTHHFDIQEELVDGCAYLEVRITSH
jgi:hypothetical protein